MNCDHMFVIVGKELAQKIEFISYKSPNALTLPVSKVEKGRLCRNYSDPCNIIEFCKRESYKLQTNACRSWRDCTGTCVHKCKRANCVQSTVAHSMEYKSIKLHTQVTFVLKFSPLHLLGKLRKPIGDQQGCVDEPVNIRDWQIFVIGKSFLYAH